MLAVRLPLPSPDHPLGSRSYKCVTGVAQVMRLPVVGKPQRLLKGSVMRIATVILVVAMQAYVLRAHRMPCARMHRDRRGLRQGGQEKRLAGFDYRCGKNKPLR